ncbi:MAG: RDD family protein [Byssovorax sp.]
MSASPSPKDPPALSSVREEFSSPDDGDARGVPADFGLRFLARSLDLIFTMALSYGVGIAVRSVLTGMALGGAITPGWQVKLGALTVGTFGWSVAATTAYEALCESIGGATVGKWICGLRVYSADFSPDGTFLVALRPCSFGGALIRTLAVFVDAMFFCAIAYFSMEASRWRQRMGDRWGHTVVVKAKSTDLPPKSAIPGLLGGIATSGVLIAASLLVKLL